MGIAVIIIFSILGTISLILTSEKDEYPFCIIILTLYLFLLIPCVLENGYWVPSSSAVLFLVYKIGKKISDDAEIKAIVRAIDKDAERKKALAEINEDALSDGID